MSELHISLRNALANLTPAPSHDATQPPEPLQIYTPSSHEAVLDPERPLIIGGRGTGKSFWAASLFSNATRAFITGSYPRLGLDKYDIALGFAGVDADVHGAPSREVLDDLIETDGHSAEKVWRAVILKAITSDAISLDLPSKFRGQEGLVAWVEADAERVQTLLRDIDKQLQQKGRRVMILFDALDRLGSDWRQIRERTKALLQVVLAMRTYRSIKLKLFMRVDQAEDRGVVGFPDASKLFGAKVDLEWERKDLYGLLFTLLANNKAIGEPFINLVEHVAGWPPHHNIQQQGLPQPIKTDESIQEAIFVKLAGKHMGSDARRGKTYTWLYNHLSDAVGRVSPRSFLEALRHAANYRASADSRLVIVPKGIQAGVQSASELRLQQLKEEYGWIESVLEPLADLNVPCDAQTLYQRWQAANTVQLIQSSVKSRAYLEPVDFDDISDNEYQPALLKALMRIGVAERRTDGRINIPDIYRVAAKLLRRGGIKPSR